MAYDAGSIDASLTLDRKPFNFSMRIAQGMAQKFAASTITPAVGLNLAGFSAGIASAESILERLDGQEAVVRVKALIDNTLKAQADRVKQIFENTNPNVRVGTDQSYLRRQMSETERTLNRWTRTLSPTPIRVRAEAEIQRAFLQLRSLKIMRDSLDDEEARVVVDAQIADATTRLETVRRLGQAVGATDPTIRVSVFGAKVALADLLGLDVAARRLNGTNISMTATVDDRLSKALPQMLGDLAQQITRFRTTAAIAASMTTPLFLTKLAAMPAAAATAGAAIGGLAIQIGGGLGGAAGVAGTAVGLAGTALIGYRRAVMGTISYVGDFTSNMYSQITAIGNAEKIAGALKAAIDALPPGYVTAAEKARGLALAEQNVTYEQKRLATMMKIATPRIVNLHKEINNARLRLLEMGGAIMNATAPALLHGIGIFQRFGNQISGGATTMARNMSQASIQMMNLATSGQNLRSISTILKGIGASGVPAIKILGNVLLTLANVIAPIVPDALKLLGVIQRLTGAAQRWSASAAGQARIGAVWGTLIGQATKLWRIAVNLGKGLYGVAAALNASGVGQYLLNQLVKLSSQFANLMRAGGQGRAAIEEFGRAIKPVLAALGGLALTGAKQFFRLVDAVISLRNESTGNLAIVDIIKAASAALIPFTNVLIKEFEHIAPLLPGLIKNISEFLEVFVPATPELIFFVKTLNGLLGAFNSLPEPVKYAAARILAWTTAINMLGGGVLLGLIASFIKFRLMMMMLGRATGQNVTFFGRLGTALKKIGPAFSRLGNWVRGLGPMFTRLGSSVMRLGPFLTRLGGTLRTAGSTLLRFAAPLGRLAMQAFPALGRAIVQIAVRALPWLLRGLLALTGPVGIAVALIGTAAFLIWKNWDWLVKQWNRLPGWITGPINRMVAIIRAGLAMVGNVIRGIFTGNWKPAIDSAKKYWDLLPRPVQRLAVAFGNGLRAVGAVIRGVFNGNWRPAIAVASTLWQKLPAPVRRIGSVIGNLLRAAGGIFRGIFTGNWSTAINAAKALFQKLPSGVQAHISRIATIIRGVGMTIRAIFNGDWRQAAMIALRVIGLIAPGVQQRIVQVSRYIGAMIEVVRRLFQGDLSGAVQLALAIFGRLFPGAKAKLDQVSRYVKAVIAMVRAIFSGDLSGAVQIALAIFGRLFPGVAQILRNLVSEARNKVAEFKGYFANIDLFQAGVNAVQGLINGVLSKAGDLYNAGAGLVGGFLNAVRRRAGEKSPWKTTFENGVNAALGMARGVLSRQRDVEGAGSSTAEAAIKNMMMNLMRLRMIGAQLSRSLADGIMAEKRRVEQAAAAISRAASVEGRAGFSSAMGPGVASSAVGSSGSSESRVALALQKLEASFRRELALLRKHNSELTERQIQGAVKMAFSALSSDLGRMIQDSNLQRMVASETASSPRSK